MIDCWIVKFVELYVISIADVWSGNIKRQERNGSIAGVNRLS